MDVETELRAIDRRVLTRPVRALLGDPAASVLSWARWAPITDWLLDLGDEAHRLRASL